MAGSRAEVYREVGETRLKLWIFGDAAPDHPKPAIVFFFGGGWNTGSPAQFEKQCRHFAEKGMIAITADYRVKSRQQVPAVECVKDGKACIAWVRKNAPRLGIDPTRIAAAGGSAGGHVAACTGTLPGFGTEERSDAMILFNPALVLAPLGGKSPEGFGTRVGEKRLGAKPADLSPAHHIGPHTPPTLILHGTGDATVPYATAAAFTAEMKKTGRPCELVGYEKQPHGFFNRKPFASKTLAEADRFLAALGWLK
nr:alpha/beta hydrolase [Luteolibacter marinus]